MNLSTYIKNNTNSNNTLHTPVVSEEMFFVEHGAAMDSVMYKMNKYVRFKSNTHIPDYITESRSEFKFSINENVAARDLLITIGSNYINGEIDSFIAENNLNITLNENYNIINEGFKDTLKAVTNSVKQAGDKLKKKLEKKWGELLEKVQKFKEFMINLYEGALNSVRKLVDAMIDMFLALGCSVGELMQKIKDDEKDDEYVDYLDEKIKEASKEKKDLENIYDEKVKEASKEKNELEHIYESFGRLMSDEMITESESVALFNFVGDGLITEDEEGGEKVGWWKKLKGKAGQMIKATMNRKALKKIFLQALAYVTVTIFVPVLVGLVLGPVAAAITEVLAKIIWASHTAWKQIKKMREDLKSDEWQKMKKSQKFWRWFFFFLAMAGSAFAMYKALSSAFDIAQKILNGAADSILPSKVVQEGMKIVNSFWKWITGGDAPGYDKLVQAQEAALTKIEKIEVKKKETRGKSELTDEQKAEYKSKLEAEAKGVKASKMNSAMTDSETAKQMAKNLKPNQKLLTSNWHYKGGITKMFKDCPECEAICKKFGVNPEYLKLKSSNAGGATYWRFMTCEGDPSAFEAEMNAALKAAGKAGNFSVGVIGSGVADVVTTTEVITNVIQGVPNYVVDFIPFAGFYPFWDKKMGDGFRVRLGEKDSKKFVYEIHKDGIKEEEISEHKDQVDKIRKILLDENNNFIEAVTKNAEESDKSKIEDQFKEFKETFEENLEKIKCVTLYGKRVKEQTNESYVGLHDYLIMEGITNKNILDSLDKIRRWISDRISTAEKGKDQEETDKQRGKDHELIRKIFSKDKFADAGLGKDEKHLMAMLIYKEFEDIQYDPAAELVTTIHKLYTKCSINNKESKSKDDNNDIGLEEKVLYNKIYDILSEIKQFKKEVADNKSSDILKKFKIKPKNVETAKDTVDKLKKEIEDETPKKDTTKSITDIIDNDKSLSDDEKEEIKKLEPLKTAASEAGDEDKSTDEEIKGKDEDTSSNDNNNESDDDNGEEQAVMLFINGYGIDLAKSDKSGPRAEPYPMKGLFKTTEFITIKDGISSDDILGMLSEMLNKQITDLYNVVANKPCDKKNKVFDDNDNTTERRELGNLTNVEAADVMKKKDAGKKLIEHGGTVSAAETPDEKKQLKKLQDMNNNAVKDDKELQQEIKEINPDIVDDDGNLNEDEWERTNNMLSEYQLSKHKDKSKKGFFGKIWDAIKNFFSGGNNNNSDKKQHQYTEKELEKIASLVAKKIKKEMNESLETIVFVKSRRSLSQYINESLNK